MREYLKTYKITLTTTGPVYIGSGKSFGKKEYVFISGNEVGIVDISKLYAMIQKKHLGKNLKILCCMIVVSHWINGWIIINFHQGKL